MGYRSSSTSGTADSSGTSKTCPVPAGAAIGDIALLALEQWWGDPTNPVVTWPAGFNEIVNVNYDADEGYERLKVAWKRLTAVDTGTYSMSWGTSQWNMAHCVLLSDMLATGDPIEAVNTATVISGTSVPATAVSTAAAGDTLINFCTNESGALQTTIPSGFTNALNHIYLRTNYRLSTTSGSQSASGGVLASGTAQVAALIAVKPADAGGGTTQVSKDLALQWAVRTKISDDLQVQWNTRKTVSDTLQLEWNARKVISDDLQLQWAVRTKVSDELTLSWNVYESISSELELEWDVIAPDGVVGKDLDLRWNTEAFVGKDLALQWAVRSKVGDDLELEWNTRERIGDDLVVQWHTRAKVADELVLEWSTRELAAQVEELLWSIRDTVSRDLVLRWDTESDAAEIVVDIEVTVSPTRRRDFASVKTTRQNWVAGDSRGKWKVSDTRDGWEIGPTRKDR